MVFALHDMRMVCLLRAVTPSCVTNTVPLTMTADYLHHYASFAILQAKVKCHLSVGPARTVTRSLNKQYSARGGPIEVSFMYFTSCILLIQRW